MADGDNNKTDTVEERVISPGYNEATNENIKNDNIFECIALVCVAIDVLNKLKVTQIPPVRFQIDLVNRDLNRVFKTLNDIYEEVTNNGWTWLNTNSEPENKNP